MKTAILLTGGNWMPQSIHEQIQERTLMPGKLKVHVDDPLAARRLRLTLNLLFREQRLHPCRPLAVICIGTDRSTGDALGPLVGAKLATEEIENVHTYGTLEQPVHASNLIRTLAAVQAACPGSFTIAIDACLGRSENVGTITVGKGALKPGAGVNKNLPSVGDIYLTGIVNVGGFMEYFVLQNTRLSLVMRLAGIIAESLIWSIRDLRAAHPV
jgi:putative sporulation protein YyaC